MEDEQIPGFIGHYMDRLHDDGYREFTMLSRQYQKAIDKYNQETYPQQSDSIRLLNQRTGENKKVDHQAGIDHITREYQQKALEIAKQHGYKEEEYDKDLTEKQDKLNDLLSSRKETQKTEEPAQQPEKLEEPPLTSNQLKRQKFMEEQRKITEPSRQRGQEHERD